LAEGCSIMTMTGGGRYFQRPKGERKDATQPVAGAAPATGLVCINKCLDDVLK